MVNPFKAAALDHGDVTYLPPYVGQQSAAYGFVSGWSYFPKIVMPFLTLSAPVVALQ